MKKIVTLLCTSLVVLLMFVGPGNIASAHEGVPGCPCNFFNPLEGAEKNKVIAKFLSSDEFKEAKSDLVDKGYKWKGVSQAEVIKFHTDFYPNPEKFPLFFIPSGTVGVGVPFYSVDGSLNVQFFLNGQLIGNMPF
jgi:hypothetical protein